MAKPVLRVAWPNGNSGRAGPELVGGQKLRRKAEATHAFLDCPNVTKFKSDAADWCYSFDVRGVSVRAARMAVPVSGTHVAPPEEPSLFDRCANIMRVRISSVRIEAFNADAAVAAIV